TAQRIFVGKQRSQHHYRQEELNELMIELAGAGQRVARLKGGDPFMFGRGGEEAAALAAAGVDYCIVPGVTAGSGCTAYAGIPLTHRDHAHACLFITAHDKDGECDHDWATLVQPRQTLVVYMGLLALRGLCPKLVEHGMEPNTPAALIEKGTTPEQRVLVGTVSTLPAIAAEHEPVSPAVVIVGEVVRLRATLGDCSPTREPASAPAAQGHG
ncbi:MAG: uroporphyrinogen-III C-methyltransferase, partial [Halofilum sp. (in: g-proteobacteria)]